MLIVYVVRSMAAWFIIMPSYSYCKIVSISPTSTPSGKSFLNSDGTTFGIGGAGMGDLCKTVQGEEKTEMFIMATSTVGMLSIQLSLLYILNKLDWIL